MDKEKRVGWIAKHTLSKDIGNCAICLNSLLYKKDLIYALKCHHMFHNNCINDYCEYGWKDNKHKLLSCPVCRKQNTPDKNEASAVWAYKNKCLSHMNIK